MKIFNNLAGNLRALFGLLRILTVAFGLFWLIGLTVNTWLSYGFGQNTKLIVTVGEIALPKTAEVIELTAKNAKPGSLALQSLRGTLQMDLGSDDPKLVSVVRMTIIPSMLVVVIFSYVLFTALRNLCANIEAGDVFNEENLRLVRRIGLALIGYSLVGAVVGIWCSAAMGVWASPR